MDIAVPAASATLRPYENMWDAPGEPHSIERCAEIEFNPKNPTHRGI